MLLHPRFTQRRHRDTREQFRQSGSQESHVRIVSDSAAWHHPVNTPISHQNSTTKPADGTSGISVSVGPSTRPRGSTPYGTFR